LSGFAVQYYEKVRERNEALDLRVYALAAIHIMPPNLTAIAKRLKPNSPAPEPPKDYVLKPDLELAKPQQTKPQYIRPPKMGGGFVKGWMK
jgi:phage terminase large subunit GpA-like protein